MRIASPQRSRSAKSAITLDAPQPIAASSCSIERQSTCKQAGQGRGRLGSFAANGRQRRVFRKRSRIWPDRGGVEQPHHFVPHLSEYAQRHDGPDRPARFPRCAVDRGVPPSRPNCSVSNSALSGCLNAAANGSFDESLHTAPVAVAALTRNVSPTEALTTRSTATRRRGGPLANVLRSRPMARGSSVFQMFFAGAEGP